MLLTLLLSWALLTPTATAADPGGALPPTSGGASEAPTPALDELTACEDSLDIAIFNAPRRPHREAPLRLMVVSEQDLGSAEDPEAVRIVARDPGGAQRTLPSARYGGPPWGWVAEVAKPARGRWRFALVGPEGVLACQDVTVRSRRSGDNSQAPGSAVWRSRIKWERDTENLYSLWIEHLFEAPRDEDISWNPLSEALRDRDRNLLYDYMGLDEDRSGKKSLRINPDCADFPYALRAYFSWKLGLPFAMRPCRRGTAKRAPTCSADIITNATETDQSGRIEAFARFHRKLRATVHSSSLRSLPEDERSDFYPVALNRHGLRPGTIYADPYGHTMMVGRWYPQSATAPGVLMAIDAQPDGTIGRRIFWRGSFMFPDDDKVAGAGWKRFRPVKKLRGGEYKALSNAEIAASVDYGDYSIEQWAHGKDAFYEKMDQVINPHPLTPETALRATMDALDQQLRRRVESVQNAEDWKRDHPRKVMKMPEGGAIFITSGPWEDYSTPSRDMRLLIAMDTVLGFPERVTRVPERFELPAGEPLTEIERQLTERLARDARARSYTYTRSDGSAWTLTMADLLDRIASFEMAYDPNDCVELRWGAPEGSAEYATCQRHAPEGQRRKMERYRAWFQKRERPLR